MIEKETKCDYTENELVISAAKINPQFNEKT